MDDFKDIFSNDDKEQVNAQEPIFNNTEAPVIKEPDKTPAENEPIIPPTTPEPPKNEPIVSNPVQAQFEKQEQPQVPPVQQNAQPPVNNNYYYDPNRKTYFRPPVQQPQQPVRQNVQPPVVNNGAPNQNNNFDIPPAFNQNVAGNAPYNRPVQVKQKKSKAGLTVFLIAILVVAISVFGLNYALKTYKSNTVDGSSYSESADEKENSNTDSSSDAEAQVNSSEKSAKKDSKGNLTVTGVVEQHKSSCVGITVYANQNEFGSFYNFGTQDSNNSSNNEVKAGEGSGVIMSESKGTTYIITCAHVISDGTKFTVTLDNDKEYEAKYVGSDAQTDIGVLSIQATGLNVAEFGDSKDIEVGEDCVAIGCPGGLEFKNSVTKGIVSALDVPVASTIGYDNECIQVDAAINPGNSGGALFNMQGQVIGINSSKIASTEYEGMGFAVPSNTAVQTANSLIKNGYVKGRARLGIRYAPLSALQTGAEQILNALEEKGFKDAQGTMIVQEIDSRSDLNGKVKKNDMIVAVNGKTLTNTDIVTSTLSKSKPSDTIELTIARIDGNKISISKVKCKLIEAKE